MRPSLSVVVPCYNEEAVIGATHRRLSLVLARVAPDHEIVYVDDGSRDGTLGALRALRQVDPHVRILALSRNFGHQIAASAGIDHAEGDAVVIIDADLQDPPELIEQMLGKWREGYDVVYGTRSERDGESAFKLFTARLFYRLLNALSDTPIPRDTGDFRLMGRPVVLALRDMPEHDRFLRGMVSWVGYRQYALSYKRDARAAGQSNYPLRKMLHFAADGIFSFSTVPLRAAMWLGVASAALALAGIVYALVMRFLTSAWVSGWASLFLAVLFIGGVQLLMLGIVGEYIGRIYREGKRRPLYLVRERLGFSDDGNA